MSVLPASVRAWAVLAAALGLSACAGPDDGGVDLRGRLLRNRLAYIPPPCYTKTQEGPHGSASAAANPCYTCHADAPAPNQASQAELQQTYALPQLQAGRPIANPWTNLFVDRQAEVAAIPDADVSRYVAQDNYHDDRGRPALAERLLRLPERWDVDHDGRWGGYVPDAAFQFDAQGYDLASDGRPTGWRTFAYHPFPGAFLPANGSFDDVAIRLPAAFRQDEAGRDERTVYTVNLAIVEALIQRRDVAIDPVDEARLGVDLDHDGRLATAERIAYDWAPLGGRQMSYVGRARAEQAAGRVHLAAGLYPEGTEFLHSVRYLAVHDDGTMRPAPRMKELRYARKQAWYSYSSLRHAATVESREQALRPDKAETYVGDAEHGLGNRQGWVYQGYIEDRAGRLRPQSFEETVYCMGCHSGLSATDDGSFALARKRGDGAARGWSPGWGEAMQAIRWPDPRRADGQPEYASYLRANPSGDALRGAPGVSARYFDDSARERPEAFAALAADIRTLLLPPRERAMALNKAYWLLVREQSFSAGRDAMPAPAEHVHRELRQDAPTGIDTPLPAPRLAPTVDGTIPKAVSTTAAAGHRPAPAARAGG